MNSNWEYGASGCGAQVARLLLLATGTVAMALGSPARAQTCADPQTRPLVVYNADISRFPARATLAPGQLVEFNPPALDDPAKYMGEVAAKRAIPEWYWVGANCDKGKDCAELEAAKVPLGSTGTAEWNRTEFRIYDLKQPAVIARAEREMERALRAAAAVRSDLVFRIDNMHDLDDSRFYDRRDIRPYEDLRAMAEAWQRVDGKLRAAGVLQPNQVTGLSAHNNFAFWKRWLAEGGRPPLVLRIENPTQFPEEVDRGVAIMAEHKIPFIAIEFKKGHLYKPRPEDIEAVSKRVSMLVLMKDEDNYVGGPSMLGTGPMVLTWKNPAIECGSPAAAPSRKASQLEPPLAAPGGKAGATSSD